MSDNKTVGNRKSAIDGPEYDLYIVKLFKGCKSGRITKYAVPFGQEIKLHHELIERDIVSSTIREVIKQEMDISDDSAETKNLKEELTEAEQISTDFIENIRQIIKYLEQTYHVSFGPGTRLDSLSKWSEIIQKIACPRGQNEREKHQKTN